MATTEKTEETEETVGEFVDKYLSDDEITGHIEAIKQKECTVPTIFVCFSDGNELVLNSKEINLDLGVGITINDLGFSLAETGFMLFAVYIANPDDKIISCLTVDGRAYCITDEIVDEKSVEKYHKIEEKLQKLSITFLEGFFTGYQSRKQKQEKKKQKQKIVRSEGSKLILPGDPGFSQT